MGVGTNYRAYLCRKDEEYEIPDAARDGGGPGRAEPPREGAALAALVLFFARFFASTLAS
jgi:hypothetical protein